LRRLTRIHPIDVRLTIVSSSLEQIGLRIAQPLLKRLIFNEQIVDVSYSLNSAYELYCAFAFTWEVALRELDSRHAGGISWRIDVWSQLKGQRAFGHALWPTLAN